MKTTPIATRIIAGVLPAMALFATPALAQDVAQPAPPTTPPVAQPAPPVAATPAPAAPVAVAPASGPSDADRAKLEASAAAATGAATAPAEAAPSRAARPAAVRQAQARTAPRAAPATPAPVAEAPAPVPAVPVVTPVPEAGVTAPAPVVDPVLDDAPVVSADTQTVTDTQTTAQSGVPLWGWIVGGLAVIGLGLLAVLGLRRRRDETVWDEPPVAHEPVYADTVPASAAAAAVPFAAGQPVEQVAEHVELNEPAADEVAAITEASAPVAGRPWIELSLRPIRAGANEDTALVDLELTLANAGEVAAKNVRVSTFMLGDAGTESQMDRLLANRHTGTQVDAGEIGAGEGSRVDATLTTPREGLEGSTFQPIVVADVRYTLPNGSEGRTAAAFAVGVDDGTDDPTPLRLGGDMREDVSATLQGVLERA